MKKITLAVSALLAVVVLTIAQPPEASAATSTGQIIGISKVDALTAAGLSKTIADFFFNTPGAYIAVGANGDPYTTVARDAAHVHAEYPLATVLWICNSYGANALTKNPGIAGVFGTGGQFGPGKLNPPYVGAVMYDTEGQANGTPTAEQTALGKGSTTSVTQAAAVVHAKGLKLIFAPSAAVGMTGKQGGTHRYATWLAQNRGAWANAGEDIYSIQSQQAELSPGPVTFDQFIAQAKAQASAAAPSVPVDIGIGINVGIVWPPAKQPPTITEPDLFNAWSVGVSNGAAGYWQNVQPGATPASVYVAFLNQVFAQP